MSFTGIEATINFYTQQESDLTNQVTDILFEITQASKKSRALVVETTNQRQSVRDEFDSDTTDPGYDTAMSEINDEYQLKLSDISAWESELETKKDTIETSLKTATSYKESLLSMLKQNVQKDFKYGQSASS